MRILIADDHPIVRQGLKQMLSSDPSISVVGEAKNGDEALKLARAVDWDVAIVDFTMPGPSGLELVGEMKQAFPTRAVLVLSMHSEDAHALRALRSGASGYITKESAPLELANAVRKVANGGKYISPAVADILASECAGDANKAAPHDELSDREFRVMWMIASGRQNMDISRELGLSTSTVSTYRARVLRKLGLKDNAALVRFAIKNQLLQ